MNISKLVVLNPIEPSPLSFRAPLGMDTKLNVTYLDMAGAALPGDLAAQLQLTGRSTARTTSYLMPATDIANGRARAIIPGGDLNDPNGYRLRLVGTVNGEPSLLAMGTVMPIPAAGIEAIPDDIIDTVDLTFTYGNVVELDITVWTDSGGDVPYDLTEGAATISAAIYAAKGGSQLLPFTVTVTAANKVRLSLTVEEVATLPALCWWSMVASTSAGATVLCEGKVTVS
jgi:hypothetical protein